MDLLLGSNPWGDDFGPHERRRSIKEKLARGVPPSEGDHLDDIFDMEAELRELALELSNTRLKLARKAISEQEAIAGYKEARDAARHIFRRTRDLMSIPCEEDVSYRLENASVKMKASMTEYEEESNSLLLLLRALIPSLAGEKGAGDDGRKKTRRKPRVPPKGNRGGKRPNPRDEEEDADSGAREEEAPAEEEFDREATLEGYLLKKKKDKGGQKKRWIVCTHDSFIYYDKKDGKELGRFPLGFCYAQASKDDSGTHMLLDVEDASYIFSFTESDEIQPSVSEWCEFVSVRAKGKPNTGGSSSSSSGGGGGGGGGAKSSSLGRGSAREGEETEAQSPSGGSSDAMPKAVNTENESIEMFFAGYLLKRKEKHGKMSAPKKRYCVLEESVMRYLEKKGGNELGSMQVRDMAIALVSTEDGDTMQMKISGDTYTFSSDQQPYISEWVNKLMENGASKMEVENADESMLAAYLMKRKDKGHGKYTSAKKRYCMCDGKYLTYYEKKGAPELGSLALEGCTVSLKKDEDGSMVMIFKTGDTAHLFGNIDGSSMQNWVDFIQAATGQKKEEIVAEQPPLPERRHRNTTMRKPRPSSSQEDIKVEDGTSTVARRRRNGLDGSSDSVESRRLSRPVSMSPRSASGNDVGSSPRGRSASPRDTLKNPPRQPRGTVRERGTMRERKSPAGAAPTPAKKVVAPAAQEEDEFGI